MVLLGWSCVAAQMPVTAMDADSSVEQVLDALHARGIGLKDFSADVSLSTTDMLGSGKTTLSGKVYYQAKGQGDARMRVIFDTREVGKKIDKESKLEYLLEDGWLIERDWKRKIQVDRQVLKPGQKIDLLKLGEGPFPLPVGQPRAEVLKSFDVKKIEAAKDDPAGTVHVQLVPKAGTQFERKFKTIDVWVDLKTDFPRRIETIDPNATEVRTTELPAMHVNQGLRDGQFELEKIGNDWTRKSEAMEQ